MGLDQYMRILHKINPNDYKHVLSWEESNQLEDQGFRILTDDEDVHSIKNFALPVKVNNQYIDIRRKAIETYPQMGDKEFFDSCHIAEYCGYGEGQYWILCDPQENQYKVTLLDSEHADYIYDQVDDGFLIHFDEAAYWRKNYILQKWFQHHEIYKKEWNCVYAPVDRKILEELIHNCKSYLDSRKDSLHLFGIDETFINEDSCWHDSVTLVDQITITVKQVRKILDTTDFENTLVCYYEWW